MLQINTNNEILLDGKKTGLSLTQRQTGTVIYTPESPVSGHRYCEHTMPHARYSTVHESPSSGAAGVRQLEADVRLLLACMKA